MLAMSVLPYACYALFAGVVGYTNCIPQPGTPSYTPTPTHHFRSLFENDSVSGRDRNYSHGTRMDYAQIMEDGNAWGLSYTQNIYTPETHTHHNVPGEHPYCGYMALGAAYLMRGENFGCVTEFQVGVTGRPSLAGKAQNALHEIAKMDKWYGWKDQIPAEPTFQLTSRQEWRLSFLETSVSDGVQTDAVFFLRESVGTFDISGGGGFSWRIGHNLPESSMLTGNRAGVYGLNLIRKPAYKREDCSYFFVLEGSVNYVARDLTVDGGVFRDFERTCRRTPWQPEARAGIGLIYQGVEYYVGTSVRGRTYKTQDENSVIGEFSVAWHW